MILISTLTVFYWESEVFNIEPKFLLKKITIIYTPILAILVNFFISLCKRNPSDTRILLERVRQNNTCGYWCISIRLIVFAVIDIFAYHLQLLTRRQKHKFDHAQALTITIYSCIVFIQIANINRAFKNQFYLYLTKSHNHFI